MKRYLAILALIPGLAFSAPAAKAALVEQWSYSVSGVFGNDYGNDTNGTRQGITRRDNGVTLLWGNNPHSYITLFAASGTAVTDGPAASGMDLYHRNREIRANAAALDHGSAELTLALAPGIPTGTPLAPPFKTTLQFSFFETLNEGAHQDDIFVLRDISTATQAFAYDGQEYEFSFAASFKNLATDYADAWYYRYALGKLGLPDGTPLYGWITPESRGTTIPTWLQIRTVPGQPVQALPTPEPGTLALMGIGLIGAGVVSWRRGRR